MPTCPNCGKENPKGFRFCGFCTAPLSEAPPSGEERKVVTVLFCDLVGFTAKSDRADPEDVRAVLRPYHARLRQEIERYGGTVEKFIGDAVMAVFGAPAAHEDDAERAARASLVILDAISEMNASHPGLDLAVRTGVATGEVVVSLGAKPQEGESMVAGDVVNLAFRLQQEAAPGTVIVEETCYRATRYFINYEELAPVRVKGKADRVSVWRVLSARSRLGVDVDQEPATPFVGRQGDLALLQDTYRRVIEGAGPQVVTIVGEPGVGKTRLLFELRRWVDDREEIVWWRQGRCLPYGDGITFWALGEVVKAQAGILESDDLEAAEAQLAASVEAVVEEGSEQEWIRSRLAPLVGAKTSTEGQATREEAFTAWRRFFEALATARPLILLFEDIHWADEEMLEFVEHLVDWSAGVSLLILCTARPELFDRVPGWGGGKKNSSTIALAPLSEKETAELMADLLPEVAFPAHVQTTLLDRSGGNPLYAEEFARMLLDRGFLESGGHLLESTWGEGIPVPETVQALIAARLDLLPRERKSLLQDASVVGKVFWSSAVAFMSGVEERDVLQALHELARAELIRPARRSSMQDQAEYSFWHVLVREGAYGQIPRGLRSRKHWLAAKWIEKVSGERVVDHSEILAAHYTEALELARASGDIASQHELREGAVRFLVMAGDRSFELDATRSEGYYRRALEMLPGPHADRPAVMMKVGRAADLRGRPDEAEEMYRRAIAEYQERSDPVGAGEALVALADLLWVSGDPSGSQGLVDEAIRILETEPPGEGLALAYILKSRTLWRERGREGECLAWAERGLSLARGLDAKALLVRAMGYRAEARIRMGNLDQALEEERQALDLAISLGLGRETVRLYTNVAWEVRREDLRAALDLYEEGIDFAERRTLAHGLLKAGVVVCLALLGRWDECFALAEEATASAPSPWDRLAMLMTKAWVLLHRGDVDTAASLMDVVVPEARQVAPLDGLVYALEVGALVKWRHGDQGEAKAIVKEIEGIGALVSTYDVLDLLWILLWAEDSERANRLLAGTRPPANQEERHALLTARAIVAEMDRRLEEGADLYAEAAKQWGQFSVPFRQGEALLGAGRCLVGLGRPDGARARLDEARQVFEPLGARLFIQEIDALLARVAALSS